MWEEGSLVGQGSRTGPNATDVRSTAEALRGFTPQIHQPELVQGAYVTSAAFQVVLEVIEARELGAILQDRNRKHGDHIGRASKNLGTFLASEFPRLEHRT